MDRLLQHIAVAAVADSLTFLFMAAIGVAFIAFLVLLRTGGRRIGAVARGAPGTLTSLGVLGTFAGIFVGLMEFDVHAIDDSVPQLLEGMKTAFLTSLAGISASIVFKMLQPFLARPDENNGDASAADLLNALRDIQSEHAIGQEKLRQAITGDAEASLSTQLTKLRTTTGDGFSDLRKDFQSFAEKVAENNSRALIDALNEVIRDFNAKINEQFGENFKHLNQAVAKLLDWQVNYRIHMETITERFERAGDGISAIEAATIEIANQARTVPEAMSKLGDIMQAARHQLDDLERHLEAFAAVREKAVGAFPAIEQNLERVTAGMKTQTDAMEQAVLAQTQAQNHATNHFLQAVEAQSKSYNTLQEGFRELQSTASKAIGDMREDAVNAVKDAGAALVDAVERQGVALKQAVDTAGNSFAAAGQEHHQAMQRAAEKYEKAVEQTLKQTGDTLSEQIQALDAQMQEELTRAVNALGRNLAGLSEKFVADYMPLTEKLRRLVDTARVIAP